MPAQTLFGFRLDRVTLHHGMMRTAQSFDSSRLEHYDETFLESLAALESDIVGHTRIGPLRYDRFPEEIDTEDDNLPAIRIQSMSISRSRIDFVGRVGRQGSHDLAIALDPAEDAELGEKASSNPFHASLYLPQSGNDAILVSEVRSRTSAGAQILKLVSVLLFERAVADRHDDNPRWWRFRLDPVSDAERLKEVLSNGNTTAMQLEKREASNGKSRTKSSVILRRNGLPGSKLKALQAVAFGWAGLKMEDGTKAPQGNTAVEQLAGLIGVNVDASEFNDGSISYDDAEGRTQTLRPANVMDVFIYPVGKGQRPSARELRTKAEERLRKLQPVLRISLDI